MGKYPFEPRTHIEVFVAADKHIVIKVISENDAERGSVCIPMKQIDDLIQSLQYCKDNHF